MLGTFVVITAFGTHRPALHTAVDAAFDEIRRVDALMSLHRPDSELVRLNSSALQGPVRVSPELFAVIAAAQEIARETDGRFDITTRPLSDLWGFLWKQHRLPSEEEREGALRSVGHRWVELDPSGQTVRFARPGVSVDLGGIAKGYAVDKAVERLRALGVTNVMVRAGGDLRVAGTPPDESFWRVQLEDPEKTGRRTAIRLRDAAVSTSGNYENFFMVEGRRYSHLLDPRTGFPVQGVAACSVVAPTCMQSDAWATALFVLAGERRWGPLGDRLAFRVTFDAGVPGADSLPVVESRKWQSTVMNQN